MPARAVVDYQDRGFALERPDAVFDPPGTGCVRAGAAEVDLTPALGVDVAGFGFRASQHSRGVYGRIRGSLLVLEGGDGSRVLLVTLDLLAGTRFLAEALGAEIGPDLGLGVDRIWLCASHTHAAPGHLFGDRFYDCLAARANDFDVDTATWMVRQLAAGARAAVEGLEPAKVGVGSAAVWGLVWQRSLIALSANLGNAGWMSDDTVAERVTKLSGEINGAAPPPSVDAERRAVDARVRAVWAETLDGRPIGVHAVVNGTPSVLPAHMAVLTPDATGIASRRVVHALYKGLGHRVPVGVAAGVMGDTNLVDPAISVGQFREMRVESPRRRREDLVGLNERVARSLADGILRACARARERARPDCDVQVRYARWTLPEATGPGYALPAEHQVGNAQFGGSELNRTPLSLPSLTWWSLLSAPALMRLAMRWVTGEASQRRRQWWWPVPVRLPVLSPGDLHAPKNHVIYDVLRRYGRNFYGRNLRAGDGLDPYLPLRHLRIGEVELLGLPAEPTTVVAHRLAQVVRPEAPHEVIVMGVVSGYVGYATTRAEYQVQDYEAAATLWGRDFGAHLLVRTEELLATPPRRPGAVVDGQAHFDTDARPGGPPVHLAAPTRPLQPFEGEASVTIGPMRDDVVRLDLPGLPEPVDPAPRGDALIAALADHVRDDVDRLVLWGRWFSEPPDATARNHPLGAAWSVRLEARVGGAWELVRWGPCVVDDTQVSFYLRRGVSADQTRVRWTWSVRLPPDLLADGTVIRLVVAERPGLAPLAGSEVRTWAWSSAEQSEQAAQVAD